MNQRAILFKTLTLGVNKYESILSKHQCFTGFDKLIKPYKSLTSLGQ